LLSLANIFLRKVIKQSVPLASELAASLRMVVARLHRILRQQAMGDLTLTQLSCLAVVGREGPLPIGDVAVRENLAAPTVTKVIVNLETRGLVQRLTDPADRRVSLIAATTTGNELLDQIRRRRTAYLNRRLARLDPDDLAKIHAALPILERLANEESEGGER
jgi:DNA-binding MarR family transcriptional regulator